MLMDKLDKRILQELQANGAITNLELADKIGLSPSPCARRVKQLEEAGIIKGQVTLLNASKLELILVLWGGEGCLAKSTAKRQIVNKYSSV